MVRWLTAFLLLVTLDRARGVDLGGEASLSFVPQEVPEGFGEQTPQDAAVALVRAAYAASGVPKVDLGYVGEPSPPPARLVVSHLTKLGNHDEAETCLAVAVHEQQAAIVASHSHGRYRFEDLDPKVIVVLRHEQPERLRHAAQVIWYLGFVRRLGLPNEAQPPRPGLMALSSTIRYEALTISDGTAVDGGVIAIRSNERLPRLGPEYGPDHHFTVGTWLLRTVAGTPPQFGDRRHSGAATQTIVAQVLDPAFALPLPWTVLGHAAQAAGVNRQQDLSTAISTHLTSLDPDQVFLRQHRPVSSPHFDQRIREAASLAVAVARLGEARDRLTRSDDVDYLAEWITAGRSCELGRASPAQAGSPSSQRGAPRRAQGVPRR